MVKQDILIIDDDTDLAMITRDMLEDYGHRVFMAACAQEAYRLLEAQAVQLILLDINLPDETGFELLKQIRRSSTVPILFISARTSEKDRITGLDLGGDDYLPKPYSLQELISRINACLRRTYGFTNWDRPFCYGDIEADLTVRKIKKSGKLIPLSLKEYDLFACLIQHKNQVLKKENLLAEVWGAFSEVELATVAVHIRWLREKLEDDPAKPRFIKTVWGIGYILETGDIAHEK